MKAYISGKITGIEDQARIQFQQAYDHLRELGIEAINPFNNGLTDDNTWEQQLAIDIKILLKCDTLIQLPGWEDSRGARLEYEIAQIHDIDIISYKDLEKCRVLVQFPKWESTHEVNETIDE